VTYPGFTPVGNATLVVANVLTCNKHSKKMIHDRDTMQVLVHDVHTRGLAIADHDAHECRVILITQPSPASTYASPSHDATAAVCLGGACRRPCHTCSTMQQNNTAVQHSTAVQVHQPLPVAVQVMHATGRSTPAGQYNIVCGLSTPQQYTTAV
jgi:hypothetical protein